MQRVMTLKSERRALPENDERVRSTGERCAAETNAERGETDAVSGEMNAARVEANGDRAEASAARRKPSGDSGIRTVNRK